MKCRMCGYEFDEKQQGPCKKCGKCKNTTVHCPNCGYGNDPRYESDFKFITVLKNKLKNIS